jgi:phage-related protein
VKRLRFLGDSLKCLRDFPADARHDAGYHAIGKGVEEIRVWDTSGIFRVSYMARLADAVYVLHAFQKKTQVTAKHDIELAKSRHTELVRGAL